MAVRSFSATALAVSVVLLAAAPSYSSPPEQDWVRTETRPDCASYSALRSPFFGELHSHTSYSGDAVFVRVQTTPRDAYMFSKGQQIGLPPYDINNLPTRFAQLHRPLDFAAVTDHAEWLGEIRTCLTSNLPGYDDQNCEALRDEIASPPAGISSPIPLVVIAFQSTIQAAAPARLGLCGAGDVNCLTQAALVWQDEQAAAAEFYDNSSACTFTTFPAYEWTNNLNGYNVHRNIIFRNAEVPALPTSYYEEPHVEGLFGALESDCLDAAGNCDFLSIPHNSNASGGLMFESKNSDGTPLTKADAERRSTHERLVEVFQHKGSSECAPWFSTNDELCGFEQLHRQQLFQNASPATQQLSRNFVRYALQEGLRQEDLLGANPFKLGLVGGTDTHNSTPGGVVEADFATNGHLGVRDGIPENLLSRIGPGGVVTNGGGLTVLWAEENSRDALFAAMRRREAYATSGTRPIVRFFAGRPPADLCDSPSFVETGYDRGVPMGGDIGPVLGSKSPRFAVMALQDPGGNGEPSTPLQRIQIVKGWVDSDGNKLEQVFDVAGDPNNGATVDTNTCTPSGSGFASLCAVWSDPTFRADERAYYYARVIENPVCRWSTRLCNSLAVDCTNPGSVPTEYQECCGTLVEKTIQERAWTSPVFYEPEGFGVASKLKYGKTAGEDSVKLRLVIGRVASSLDVSADGLSLVLQDDDDIVNASVPAASFVTKKPGKMYIYTDKTGSIEGITAIKLKIGGHGTGKMIVSLKKTDLSAADQTTHDVTVHLTSGTYDTSDTRAWEFSPGQLVAQQ